MRVLTLAFAVLLGASLSGCDGEECWLCWGGQPNQGRLTLSLTAVPTDQISALVLSVSGIAFLNEANNWQRLDFDPPRQMNLLPDPNQLPGQEPFQRLAVLLDQEHLDGGTYQAIRLSVNGSPGSRTDSFVRFSGPTNAQYPLRLSSDADALTLNKAFTMPRHGPLNLIIDFDLHSGLHGPQSAPDGTQFFELSPDMRLVEFERSGSASGTIASRLTSDPLCTQSNGGFTGFVYAFAGGATDPRTALQEGSRPISSTPARLNGLGSSFEVNFLPVGDYTLAFVCEGEAYRPYASTNIAILRTTSRPVQVRAGGTTGVPDFSQ